MAQGKLPIHRNKTTLQIACEEWLHAREIVRQAASELLSRSEDAHLFCWWLYHYQALMIAPLVLGTWLTYLGEFDLLALQLTGLPLC